MIDDIAFWAFLATGVVAIVTYLVGEERGWHNLERRDRRPTVGGKGRK